MITRIELTNFMSHKHTVIEPAPGLTVLVGPNNIGKSAIVAALQILCYNENSTYVSRHGERECSVKVITDDGHTVEWRRKNSPSYIVDGQTFDRLRGSGLPEELHQLLRLPKVDTDGESDIDIHFGAQKSPIFLLGNSAASKARFFASSSDAIRLVQIQKRHKEKFSEAQRDKNRLEAESRKLNAELESLEPIVEVDRRLAMAEQAHTELIRNEAWLSEARKHEVALDTQAAVLTRHAVTFEALSSLPPPPELMDVQPVEDLIVTLGRVMGRRAQSQSQVEALRALFLPPEQIPTEALAELITKTENAETEHSAAQARFEAVARLPPPPQMEDISLLVRLTQRGAGLTACVKRNQEECGAMSGLSSPPPIADTDPLQTLVGWFDSAARKSAAANDRHSALQLVQGPPELVNEAPFLAIIVQLAEASQRLDHLQQTLGSLAGATSPPASVDMNGVLDCVRALEQASAQFRISNDALAASEADLDSAGADLRSRSVDSLCPVCGNALDADQVIARAIAGQGGHEHG